MKTAPHAKTVAITEFKRKCLGYIDQVARGKVSRLVITRRDRPVATVSAATAPDAPVFGCMAGMVTVSPGADLTAPTGEAWDAES